MENYHIPMFAKIDNDAPSFNLPYYDPKTDDEGTISLEDIKGKWSVLFFYPADFTFVCPTELKDLTDVENKFNDLGVDVLTISTDTIFSHRAWIKHEKLLQGFPYKMLADHSTAVSDVYNLLDENTGIAGRGTFIIDPDGIIRGIEITSGSLGRNSDELVRKIEALKHMRENPTEACPAKWTTGDKTLTPSIKIAGEIYEALND